MVLSHRMHHLGTNKRAETGNSLPLRTLDQGSLPLCATAARVGPPSEICRCLVFVDP
jgi:hypothetical protein